MRDYILVALKRLDGDRCKMCSKVCESYDIHHETYSPENTIYDLCLLCKPCHKSITDFRPLHPRNQYS